jgi:SAM-dependent methyltransferase
MLGAARRIAKRLPGFLQSPLRVLWRRLLNSGLSERTRYRLRIAAEQVVFEGQTEVHDLPEIFHYWSNRYLRPKFESFGFSNPDDFFLTFAAQSLRESTQSAPTLLSIGSGNCDTEVRLALGLRSVGLTNFTIECIDLNARMLARGRELAQSAGLVGQFRFVEADFNRLNLSRRYDCVVANQSLHHVVELEHLFGQVSTALLPHGRFLVSDMIGRNGHMRWPEALVLVEELWASLPESRKYNHQLRRLEREFVNWDNSGVGFEGVRAQDVLPCMARCFKFELFVGYGNVIDIFIDRSFGPNFDAEDPADRAFIDKVHAIDEAAIHAGTLTPTHAVIVARSADFAGATRCWNGLTPERAIRDPATSGVRPAVQS